MSTRIYEGIATETGTPYISRVRVLSLKKLREYWEKHRQAEGPLSDWYNRVTSANWANPAEVKLTFRSADFVGDRVVFNIGGHNYRLIVWVIYASEAYPSGKVLVKWVGTHAEYSKIKVGDV
jgi:mRNA interferase HigB